MWSGKGEEFVLTEISELAKGRFSSWSKFFLCSPSKSRLNLRGVTFREKYRPVAPKSF